MLVCDDFFDPGELAADLDRLRRERIAQFERSVRERDLSATLGAMFGCSGPEEMAPFVWPEVYAGKTLYCQRFQKKYFSWIDDLKSAPVLMRGAKDTLYYVYTKSGWAIRVFERYLRFYRLTVIDQPLSNVFRALYDRLAHKHCIATFTDKLFYYRQDLQDYVVVGGRLVPMDRERIKTLEKGLRVIEKIDALAA